MKKKLDKISTIIDKILKARGLENRLCEYNIRNQWEKAVGTVIAYHARPQTIYGKKLMLIVDSTAWMQQLSLLKPELVENINKHFGREIITDITLRLGELMLSSESADSPAMQESLTREDQDLITACLQEIRDPDIRLQVQRVMEKDLLNRKNKLQYEK